MNLINIESDTLEAPIGGTAALEAAPPQTRTRGLFDGDDRAFAQPMAQKLKNAQHELQFLLDRGYPMKSAVSFVGRHHQFSARQLLALVRTTSSSRAVVRRISKRLEPGDLAGKPVYIDGFNLLITLEVALSNGVLLLAQDGTVRDLAELRGTYRPIPQTEYALAMLCDALGVLEVSSAAIFLDEPVSNSGNLKSKIYEFEWPVPLAVELVRDPDMQLKKLPQVITGDSVILDACVSWFSMAAWILEHRGIIPVLTRLVRLG